MILNKQINYRPFYAQTDLYFKFDISSYGSKNFDIGLSGLGGNFFYFSFVSGLIKSPDSKIIGSFYKEPISIHGYIQKKSNYQSILNYYLNNVPIDRSLFVGNQAILSNFFALIHDYDEPSSEINLDIEVYGNEVPDFEFSDFQLISDGLSGKIINRGNYSSLLFSMSSSDVTGPWLHPSQLNPNQFYNFYNKTILSLPLGSIVTLNLETDAGLRSYKIQLESDTEGGTVNPVIDPPQNTFARFFSFSGSISENEESEKIYQIDYNLGDKHTLDFEFDYYTGKYGDLLIKQMLPEGIPIVLSGDLPAENGRCSGYLFNSDLIVNVDKSVDINSPLYPINQSLNFSLTSVISGYFDNLEPVGLVNVTANLNSFNFSTKDTDISQIGLVDLGGSAGQLTSPSEDTILTYSPIKSETVKIEAVVGGGDYGKHTFYNEVIATGNIFLKTSIDKDYGEQGFTTYPYRGVGIASLLKYAIATADSSDNKKYWTLIEKENPALVYRDRQHRLKSSLILENNFIYGFISNKNNEYKFTNGIFTNGFIYEGDNLCNEVIERFIDFYENLDFLPPLDSKVSTLSIDTSVDTNTNYEINLDTNNFLIHSFKNNNSEEKVLIFESTLPHICYSFDDSVFLYSNMSNRIANLSPSSPLNPFNLLPDLNQTYYHTVTSVNGDSQTIVKAPKPLNETVDNEIFFKFINCSYIKEKSNNDRPFDIIKISSSKGGYIQIPFKTDRNKQTFDFVFSIKATDKKLQFLLSNNAFIKENVDIQYYVNFEISNAASNVTVQASPNIEDFLPYFSEYFFEDVNENLDNTSEFRKIRIRFTCDSPERTHYLMLRFVNDINITRLQEQTDFNSEISLKDIGLYTDHNISDIRKFVNRTASYGYLSFQAIFDYFIHKIYKINGSFYYEKKILSTDNSVDCSRIVFRPDRTEASIYGSELFGSDVKFLFYKMLGGLANEWNDSIYLDTEYSNDKILNVFSPTTVFAKPITISDLRTDTIDPFFSIGTDFVDLYVKAPNGVIIPYLASNSIYGSAVNKIIKIIKEKNADYSKRYIVKNGETFSIPRQLSPNELKIATDDAYLKKYTITCPTQLFLNIPYGKARYYDPDLGGLGFFYETPSAIGLLPNQRLFPENAENFNVFRGKYVQKTVTLNRLLYLTQDVYLNRNFDGQTVYLTNGFFEKIKVTDQDFVVEVSGLLKGVSKKTNKVWDFSFADDVDFTRGVVNLIDGPDRSVYSRNGIATNDNTFHSKFFKIKYLNPPEVLIDSSDSCVLSLIVKSGVQVKDTQQHSLPE